MITDAMDNTIRFYKTYNTFQNFYRIYDLNNRYINNYLRTLQNLHNVFYHSQNLVDHAALTYLQQLQNLNNYYYKIHQISKSIEAFQYPISQMHNFEISLQKIQPLLNPEYVHILSWLAESAQRSFDHDAIELAFPEPDFESLVGKIEKQAALAKYKEEVLSYLEIPLSDTLLLKSPYSLDFLNVWSKIPEKSQFLETLSELIIYCCTMMFMTDNMPTCLLYATTIKTLVQIYKLGSVFLWPAIKSSYDEASDQSNA